MKLCIIFILLFPLVGNAFEINVWSKYDEKSGIFKDGITSSPVHENLLSKSVKDVDERLIPRKERSNLIHSLAEGVRWNDDPLNLLKNKTKDFLVHFVDSCRSTVAKQVDVTWDLLYRTHCGDMQFLHSMASSNKELSADTLKLIKAWIEFTYKVSTGEYPIDYRFRSADHMLSQEGANTFKKIMINPYGGRKLWTPALMFGASCDRDFNLLRKGRPTELKCKYRNLNREQVMNYALGSLIHLVQDSFSHSHSARKKGVIKQFGLYTSQSSGKHKEADKSYSSTKGTSPELIEVTTRILNMALKDRETEGSNWEEFSDIISGELFVLEKPNALPGNLGFN